MCCMWGGSKTMTNNKTKGMAAGEADKRQKECHLFRGMAGLYLLEDVRRIYGLTFHLIKVLSGIKNICDVYYFSYNPVNYLVMTFY